MDIDVYFVFEDEFLVTEYMQVMLYGSEYVVVIATRLKPKRKKTKRK